MMETLERTRLVAEPEVQKNTFEASSQNLRSRNTNEPADLTPAEMAFDRCGEEATG